MKAKHQFKYTYNETNFVEYSPLEVTFEIPGEVNLTQMLNNFEQYLKACGFVFDGKLDFVEETYPEYLDKIEQEPGYGCMADFDTECGRKNATSTLDEFNKNWEKLSGEQKQKYLKEALKMSGL